MGIMHFITIWLALSGIIDSGNAAFWVAIVSFFFIFPVSTPQYFINLKITTLTSQKVRKKYNIAAVPLYRRYWSSDSQVCSPFPTVATGIATGW